MKSVFLGTRLEALMEVSLKTKVIKVITTKKSFIDKYANKNKFKITYVDKKNKMRIFNFIKNTEAKLIFSSGFPYKIPKKYIDFKKIFINSHPSLLPKYKGLTPVRDALKQNEKEMGVSVHYMMPLHKMGYYKKKNKSKNKHLKNSSTYGNMNLSLPVYPKLKISEVDYICESIKKLI